MKRKAESYKSQSCLPNRPLAASRHPDGEEFANNLRLYQAAIMEKISRYVPASLFSVSRCYKDQPDQPSPGGQYEFICNSRRMRNTLAELRDLEAWKHGSSKH